MEQTTIDGLTQYLTELRIAGCGEITCRRIAEEFGDDTIEVCLDDWQRLTDIEGIGQRKALAVHEAIKAKHGGDLTRQERRKNQRRMEQTRFFGSIGVHGWTLHRILDKYGEQAKEVVEGDPYRLTELDGFGFTRADEVAEKLGITGSDPRRVRAGIVYTLQKKCDEKAHCFLPYTDLVKHAAAELAVDTVAVEVQMAVLEANELTIRDGDDIYLPQLYWAEVRVAQTLRRMMTQNGLPPSRTTDWGQRLHEELEEQDPFWMFRHKRQTVEYNALQQQAIDMAQVFRVMILTGGPGTGKTTTLLGILNNLKRAGMIYKLCAPTGKAQKRMSEQTGEEAQTIHRLLEYHPDMGFRRDRMNPLHCDVVVVDEASMIDILLMQRLCDAIPQGGRLIIVGDADQLPSVGAGNVLHDLIESDIIPTVKLTEIHRQKEGSLIIQNAHRIINGKMPIVRNDIGSDFFFREVHSDAEAADVLVQKVTEGLPTFMPGAEIQVLSPMRKEGVKTSCPELNARLQKLLNPDGPRMMVAGIEWRIGDRVMQTKNDYDENIYNGDTGIIIGGSEDEKYLCIDFDGRHVVLEGKAVYALQLCYATTIHKSQGSEYDVVVIPITDSHYTMLHRNLLYTGVTRAKKMCVLIGTERALRAAVQGWNQEERNTRLKERLINN